MALSTANALSLDDCQCLLCLGFLIEPVTLPCKHTLCKGCLQARLREAFASCPFCGTGVSSWAQDHTPADHLINKELWDRIQAQNPEECRYRSRSLEEEMLSSLLLPDDLPVPVLRDPGELRKEYEVEMTRMEAEPLDMEEIQNDASKQYIRQLLAKDMEDERTRAEQRRLEGQKQRDEEEAKKLSVGGAATSPRKRKCKLKHCDTVSKFPRLQSQPESALQYDAVLDGVKTDLDGKGRQRKSMPAATAWGDSEIPVQGYALFYGYDKEMDTSENEASKPSCSRHNFYGPPQNTKPDGSQVSGIPEETGNSTTEAKEKMSHPLSSKPTSEGKHRESSGGAVREPAFSYESGFVYEPDILCEMAVSSSSDEDEAQVLMTNRLTEWQHLCSEKYQQEEEDRLLALALQREWDEEEMWKMDETSPTNSTYHYDAFPPDTSAKGECSKEKDI